MQLMTGHNSLEDFGLNVSFGYKVLILINLLSVVSLSSYPYHTWQLR